MVEDFSLHSPTPDQQKHNSHTIYADLNKIESKLKQQEAIIKKIFKSSQLQSKEFEKLQHSHDSLQLELRSHKKQIDKLQEQIFKMEDKQSEIRNL